MPRAILSVWDKTNISQFAVLSKIGWELVSTGGTAVALEAAGAQVRQVSDETKFPELLGGRIKTLHPAIHAGILARDLEEDAAELQHHGIGAVNLVVVNLYPFEATVADPAGVTFAKAIEHIDIGGSTLLRAAAKNCARVTVLVDPEDYLGVISVLAADEKVSMLTRFELARKAWAHSAHYEAAISAYFAGITHGEARRF